jgi:hypothetical protein
VNMLMNLYVVGFKVLKELVMKSSTFWEINLCSLLKVNQHFVPAVVTNIFASTFIHQY